MSDDHDWVRRLLADAGQSPEPMPPEVADRLTRVLDELAADHDRAGTEPHGPTLQPESTGNPVVAMTPRRQRRWAGAVLAAAAVTLGGYSLTATGVLDGLTGGAESASSADSAGGRALADEEGPDAPVAGSGAESEVQPAESSDGGSRARDLEAPQATALASSTLRRDAARLVSAAGSLQQDRGTPGQGSLESPATGTQGCVPPPGGAPGTRTAVTYDARPATAVLRRVPGGRVEVQLWDCGSPTRLARVVVRR